MLNQRKLLQPLFNNFINNLQMFSNHIKTHEKSRETLKALEPTVYDVTFCGIFQQLLSPEQKQKKIECFFTKQ